jgi:hypothetical protein
MRRAILLMLLPATLLLAACDLDPKALLQNQGEDGSISGAEVDDLDQRENRPEIDGGAVLGRIGPSNVGAGEYSGATFTFEGTGERVCIIVDPQSVFRDDRQTSPTGEVDNPWMSDFPYDDGDLDLLAGLASFYTGTPGVELGDFFGSFPDSNGVDRAIDLNLCLMEDYHGSVSGSAGRATPEWCSFVSEVGTTYMGVLQVFSVPVDDDELTYVLEVRAGDCPPAIDECTLRGDYDEMTGDGELPGGFANVEAMYCDGYQD